MEGLVIDTDLQGKPYLRVFPDGVEVEVASRARAAKRATVFLPRESFEKVVLFRRKFNARTPATITGPAVAWSYADGHGMELVAVLRRGAEFELWLPGHHGHGPGTRYRGRVEADGAVRLERLPSAPRLEV